MYEVIAEERLVCVKLGRRVTIDEIAAYVSTLKADPQFDPSFSEIIDLTEVEEFRIDARAAMALADRVDPFSLNARRAFVAHTEAQFHSARMHQLLRGAERNIGIFASAQEAREWVRSGEATTPQKTPRSMKARAGK